MKIYIVRSEIWGPFVLWTNFKNWKKAKIYIINYMNKIGIIFFQWLVIIKNHLIRQKFGRPKGFQTRFKGFFVTFFEKMRKSSLWVMWIKSSVIWWEKWSIIRISFVTPKIWGLFALWTNFKIWKWAKNYTTRCMDAIGVIWWEKSPLFFMFFFICSTATLSQHRKGKKFKINNNKTV